MSKQKKKRNKAYTGAGAATVRPTITRVQAVNRSKAGQWLFDNKRLVKTVSIIAGILFLIVVLIIGIIGLFI